MTPLDMLVNDAEVLRRTRQLYYAARRAMRHAPGSARHRLYVECIASRLAAEADQAAERHGVARPTAYRVLNRLAFDRLAYETGARLQLTPRQ